MDFKIVGNVTTRENEGGRDCLVNLNINSEDEHSFIIYTDKEYGDISLSLNIKDVKRALKEFEEEENMKNKLNKEIKDYKDYKEQGLKVLVGALKIIKPDITDLQAENIISNVGNYIQLKRLNEK